MTAKPWHQRLITYISFVLLGLIAFGGILDAIANTFSIITFNIGIWVSTILIAFWIIIEIWIRRKKPIWISESNIPVRIKKLGLKIRLALIGVLILLWLPIIETYFTKSKVTDELTKIEFGQSKDYLNTVFGVPNYKWQDSIYSFQKHQTNDGFLVSIFNDDGLCAYFINCDKIHPYKSFGFDFIFNKTTVQEILLNDNQSYEFVPSGRGKLTTKPILMYSNSLCRTAHRTCNPNTLHPNCSVFISNECVFEEADFLKSHSKISSLLCCNSYEMTDYILENFILLYSEHFAK